MDADRRRQNELLIAIVQQPDDGLAILALADHLEEVHGRPWPWLRPRAELPAGPERALEIVRGFWIVGSWQSAVREAAGRAKELAGRSP